MYSDLFYLCFTLLKRGGSIIICGGIIMYVVLIEYFHCHNLMQTHITIPDDACFQALLLCLFVSVIFCCLFFVYHEK